jgi:hypothetical protein
VATESVDAAFRNMGHSLRNMGHSLSRFRRSPRVTSVGKRPISCSGIHAALESVVDAAFNTS